MQSAYRATIPDTVTGVLARQILLHQAPPSLLQQLTPLAAPLAALVGVWLGGLLESRRSRDERIGSAAIESYARFILVCHDCSRAAVDILESPGDTEPAQHAILRDTTFRLKMAASEIELLSPQPIASQGTTVAQAALLLSDELATRSQIDDARAMWEARTWIPLETFERELSAFIKTVKKNR